MRILLQLWLALGKANFVQNLLKRLAEEDQRLYSRNQGTLAAKGKVVLLRNVRIEYFGILVAFYTKFYLPIHNIFCYR